MYNKIYIIKWSGGVIINKRYCIMSVSHYAKRQLISHHNTEEKKRK